LVYFDVDVTPPYYFKRSEHMRCDSNINVTYGRHERPDSQSGPFGSVTDPIKNEDLTYVDS